MSEADDRVDSMSDPDAPARAAKKAGAKPPRAKPVPEPEKAAGAVPEPQPEHDSTATEEQPGADVAIREQTSASLTIGAPSATEWAVLRQQCQTLAKSRLVPSNLYNREDDIMLIVLTGRELAIPPTMALSRIHVVEGKPTLSAEVMRALVAKAGHRIRITERSRERATVVGIRSDDPDFPMTVTFDMEDAKAAGLATKGTWQKYPADMCLARATSALCRALFPDVLLGMTYAPEDFDAVVDSNGNVLVGEVVSERAEPEPPRPLSAADTDRVRADVFAAFEASDPRTALSTIWSKVGPSMDVTQIADENGELVLLATFLRKAIDAFKAGGRLHDAMPGQMAAQTQTTQPEPGVTNDDSDGTGHVHEAQPDADGIVDADIVPEPGDEAAAQAAAAPLAPAPVTPAPIDPEAALAWLRGEIETLAMIFGASVEALTAREARTKGRPVEKWTLIEMQAFTQGFRPQAVEALKAAGKTAAAQTYGMLKPSQVVDVKSMLEGAI